ncbi:MAG TPA: lytic transglycosylase domain-containing protein [Bordetella sp.]
MTDASMAGLFRRLAQGVHHQLAEWLRISSVYLGIAVIVTVSMGFALPGLRDQALQVHKALLTALAPESAMPVVADTDVAPVYGADSPTAVAMAVPDAPASTATSLSALARQQAAVRAVQSVSPVVAPSVQFESLRNYIARKYKVAYDATAVLIDTAYRVGREKKLDPLLVLAVIAVESSYNPLAESAVGAQGLMQVMPRVHRDKFEDLADHGKAKPNALDPVANIIVGSGILRDCITQRGSVAGGLACYEGAAVDDAYAARVQAERRRLALASGVALARDD